MYISAVLSPRNMRNQYLVTRDDNRRRTDTLSTLLQNLRAHMRCIAKTETCFSCLQDFLGIICRES